MLQEEAALAEGDLAGMWEDMLPDDPDLLFHDVEEAHVATVRLLQEVQQAPSYKQPVRGHVIGFWGQGGGVQAAGQP